MQKRSAILLCLAGLIYLTAPAPADGYDQFTYAETAQHAGKKKLAIEAYTKALEAGDLAPVYVPIAHLKRGYLYNGARKCKSALEDANAVLSIRPKDDSARTLHAFANICLGHKEAGYAELENVAKGGKMLGLYALLANHQWKTGDFAKAAQNYLLSLQKNTYGSRSHNAYKLLWYAMSAARAGTADSKTLDKEIEKLNDEDWPMPVLDFYRGQISRDDMYKKATDGDEKAIPGQKCEANFYLGEWLRGHDRDAEGLKLVQKAAKECPKSFVEYDLATDDLARTK